MQSTLSLRISVGAKDLILLLLESDLFYIVKEKQGTEPTLCIRGGYSCRYRGSTVLLSKRSVSSQTIVKLRLGLLRLDFWACMYDRAHLQILTVQYN